MAWEPGGACKEGAAYGGTGTVPASCQRDRGVWGSVEVRPTGVCVSKGEAMAGWLLEGPRESWVAVHVLV